MDRHTHERTEKAGSKRRKRSPTFTVEEMSILVDEVWQHRETLFGGSKEKKSISVKNRIWQAIATKMSPSSPCGLRDWVSVRKKWQEFQSQTKKRRARATGAPEEMTLTPDEEKALFIVDMMASEGIGGGIDVLVDEEITESSGDEEEPPGSGAARHTSSPDEDDPPPPGPAPSRLAARPTGYAWGGLTRRPCVTACTCSEALLGLEREKLAVLRAIEAQLQRQSAVQEEMLQMKREKLELQRRQLALAEAQLNQPSISVPIPVPHNTGRGHVCLPPASHSQSL